MLIAPVLWISDHEVVAGTIRCRKVEFTQMRPRNVIFYERGNYEAICNEFYNFLPILALYSSFSSIDSLWGIFRDKLLSLTSHFVPSKVVSAKRRKDKPWINKALRSSIQKNFSTYKIYCKRKKNPRLYTKLRNTSTKLKSESKVAKNAYISALADKLKTNPKGLAVYQEQPEELHWHPGHRK